MDELNSELVAVRGPRVQEISKELKDCTDEIHRLEESIFKLMEEIELIDAQLI
jgi:archaellum component FlaC